MTSSITRRSVLLGLGALALSPLVSGCQQNQQPTLSVELLQNSIPAQILKEFERGLAQKSTLMFETKLQLAELFLSLQSWQEGDEEEANAESPSVVPDLLTLGDSWLAPAIQQGLIQPLPVEALSGWEALTASWQALVRRDRQGNVAADGELWAAPYRWGSVVMVYRLDKFAELGWTPQEWSDLWRPELRHKISLLDSPRTAIGLTLKKLGYSFNEPDLDAIPELEAELRSLHEQVKFYSSDAYLQPLLLKDTWLAIGWSTDILPIVQREPKLAAIVPPSGTSLFADLWVRPAQATRLSRPANSERSLTERWIEFCWQPQIAQELSILSFASSPVLTGIDRAQLSENLRNNAILLPDAQTLERSEFLLPLSERAIAQYQSLWLKIRQTAPPSL